MQCVVYETEKAIRESVQQNKIAHIYCDTHHEFGAACYDLVSDCDDFVECSDHTEFWGKDIDGNEWRVHVHAA